MIKKKLTMMIVFQEMRSPTLLAPDLLSQEPARRNFAA
jgi:hypothetical protein